MTGLMQGANHPRRRGDGTFCPDFHGAISTDDGATVLYDSGGFGRAYPPDARQIVCWLTHVSDDPRYRWLNDVVCAGTGEVRPDQLFVDVAELVWEPPGQLAAATRTSGLTRGRLRAVRARRVLSIVRRSVLQFCVCAAASLLHTRPTMPA